MLYKLKNFKPSEEREMRPGEIKPASAEHSRTYVNVYEGKTVEYSYSKSKVTL